MQSYFYPLLHIPPLNRDQQKQKIYDTALSKKEDDIKKEA